MIKDLKLENILDGRVLDEFNRELERAARDVLDRPNIEEARKAGLIVSIVFDEVSGSWMLGYEMKVQTPTVKQAADFLSRDGRHMVIETDDQSTLPESPKHGATDEEIEADMKQIGRKKRGAA